MPLRPEKLITPHTLFFLCVYLIWFQQGWYSSFKINATSLFSNWKPFETCADEYCILIKGAIHKKNQSFDQKYHIALSFVKSLCPLAFNLKPTVCTCFRYYLYCYGSFLCSLECCEICESKKKKKSSRLKVNQFIWMIVFFTSCSPQPPPATPMYLCEI